MSNVVSKLTDWQKNIVAGTVLGGSSLVMVKNGLHHYLGMRSKNVDWLCYKMAELNGYFYTYAKHGNTYRCNSRCDDVFTEIYNIYYKDGKRHVSEENLSPLRDIGLAIWFIDGGAMTGRGNRNAYLSTTLFGESGTETVRAYFNDILEIPCTIHRNDGRLRVFFSVEGSESLLKTISHHFPSCILKQ